MLQFMMMFIHAAQQQQSPQFDMNAGYIDGKLMLKLLEPDQKSRTEQPVDCFSDVCGAPSGFMALIANRCNATITNIDTHMKALTETRIKQLLSECMCGKTDDDFDAIQLAWQYCYVCIASNQDPLRSTSLASTVYDDACSCSDPLPIDVLTRMTDPIRCNSRTRRGNTRGGGPLPSFGGTPIANHTNSKNVAPIKH